jgi:hypothetical protein
MPSESARMNSASEARFRIQATSSYSPTVKVIALDTPSESVARRLARGSWKHTTFLTAAVPSAADPVDSEFRVLEWLSDLTGQPRNLTDEVDAADLVVMVATPGGRAYAASIIGEACSLRRVTTAGLVVGGISAPEAAVSKTLLQLRPWSLMVVVADADDYIDNMLTALRA